MAKLEFLIIHCTATPEGRQVTAADVKAWHTNPKPRGNGWKQVGYSDLILGDGKRHRFVTHDNDQEVDSYEITNGVAGVNSKSRHLCYVGGLAKNGKDAKDTRTDEQKKEMEAIVREVLSYAPNVKIGGHNQFDTKACPSFDVPKWLESIGIPEKNILRFPLKVKV